jgi:hypothetical protein
VISPSRFTKAVAEPGTGRYATSHYYLQRRQFTTARELLALPDWGLATATRPVSMLVVFPADSVRLEPLRREHLPALFVAIVRWSSPAMAVGRRVREPNKRVSGGVGWENYFPMGRLQTPIFLSPLWGGAHDGELVGTTTLLPTSTWRERPPGDRLDRLRPAGIWGTAVNAGGQAAAARIGLLFDDGFGWSWRSAGRMLLNETLLGKRLSAAWRNLSRASCVGIFRAPITQLA